MSFTIFDVFQPNASQNSSLRARLSPSHQSPDESVTIIESTHVQNAKTLLLSRALHDLRRVFCLVPGIGKNPKSHSSQLPAPSSHFPQSGSECPKTAPFARYLALCHPQNTTFARLSHHPPPQETRDTGGSFLRYFPLAPFFVVVSRIAALLPLPISPPKTIIYLSKPCSRLARLLENPHGFS